MIHTLKGDLLYSDCTILIHQANCLKTMGAGLAKQISNMYPEAYKADLEYLLSSEERLGTYSYAHTRDGRLVFNLYGQYAYGREETYTNANAFEKGLNSILTDLDKFGVSKELKIGLPYGIGCDRGGGDWEEIVDIITTSFNNHQRDAYLYKYKARPSFRPK